MILIVVSALTATGFGATLMIALGRVAARADELHDSLLAEERSASSITVLRQTYAGLTRAQLTIARESSITVPSSSTSVGTQRLPVSSWTSLRPRV
jgi:hypothetical protein